MAGGEVANPFPFRDLFLEQGTWSITVAYRSLYTTTDGPFFGGLFFGAVVTEKEPVGETRYLQFYGYDPVAKNFP